MDIFPVDSNFPFSSVGVPCPELLLPLLLLLLLLLLLPFSSSSSLSSSRGACGVGRRQALMELGATVCTAKSPECSACPVKASCLAHKLTAAAGSSGGGTKRPKPEVAAASKDGSASIGAIDLSTTASIPSSSFSSSSSSRASDQAAASTIASHEDTKCGCPVCEVGDDGMAAMPEAVTDFPRKAAKT